MNEDAVSSITSGRNDSGETGVFALLHESRDHLGGQGDLRGHQRLRKRYLSADDRAKERKKAQMQAAGRG